MLKIPASMFILLAFTAACLNCAAQPAQILGYSHSWRYQAKAQDLGTSWRLPDFDDSAWPQGAGVFATAGENLVQGASIGTVLPLNDNGTFITNFYFRTTFINSGDQAFSLIATNQVDDGAVIYLNGVEVGRVAMPAGPVTANTFAIRSSDVSTYGPDVVNIPTNALVQGSNVLAVEVHQGNFGSSDMVWGMKLVAAPLPFVVITNQPQSQLAAAGTLVVFSVGAEGAAPLRYQWRKDGNPIPGANATVYTITGVTLDYAGVYSVVVSNAFNTVVSSNAVLTVATNVPAFIRTHPTNRTVTVGNTVTLSAAAGGSPPFYWQWFLDGSPIPFATSSTYSLSNVQLTNAGVYAVAVSNLYGSAVSTNALLNVGLPDRVLVALASQWKYNQNGEDLGTAWRDPSYDDSNWLTGHGVLAFENSFSVTSLTNTVLSLTNASGAPISTYYFRTRFTPDYPPQAITLVASNMIDDGAVFYINGIEYARFSMGSGAISYSSLAVTTSPEGAFFTNTIPSELLVDGENVLAVEVHQVSLDSSDIVFGMAVVQKVPPFGSFGATIGVPNPVVFEGQSLQLEATVSTLPPWTLQWYRNGVPITGATNRLLQVDAVRVDDSAAFTVALTQGTRTVVSPPAALKVIALSTPAFDVVTFTQTWRYAEVTGEIGNSWLSPAFNDSGWRLGGGIFAGHVLQPRLFPESVNTVLRIWNDLNVHIPAHYFRTWVNYPPMLSNAVVIVTNLLDDGAAFYVNGNEVERIRLPAGQLAPETSATSSPSNGRIYEPKTATWPFTAGTNLLNVRVHQSAGQSTDSAFGMRVTAFAPVTEPLILYSELVSLTVNEHAPVQFKAPIYGGGPVMYQWYRNGTPVPGATNQVLDIPAAHGSFAGEYSFTATNLINGVASAPAALSIIPDQLPPTILWVAQTNHAGTVWVRFSEAVDPLSATDIGRYTLTGVPLLGARMVDDSTVELLIDRVLVPGSALLTVTNVADLAVPSNLLTGMAVPVSPHVYRSSAGLLDVQTFFLISFENHAWSQIIGNPDCPYINNVVLPQASYANQQYSMATGILNEPNYIWMLTGTNFGLWDDDLPTQARIRSTNHLMSLLDRNGISWKTYQESISGTDCPMVSEGMYVVNHNPFVYFDSVTTDVDYCISHVRPMSELAADLESGNVTRFNYLTPNATNAMYSLGAGIVTRAANGDRWLSEILPVITNSAAYANNGCVIITWDETGGITPVGLMIMSPLAKGGGYNNHIVYDHRSILRTIQEAFGLYPLLGSSGEVPSFSDLFRDISIKPVVMNGIYGVHVSGVAADSIAWVQASNDLVDWTVIGSVTERESTFVADPGAVGEQRFYRAIGLR